MSDERPEALLKSALEKIVYFEARSEQLSNDLEGLRSEADRLRGDVAASAQREIELRRMVAELEVRVSRAHSEREESARLAETLRRERAELIGKMLEASRIHDGGQLTPEAYDLASFIAELRGEVLQSRSGAKAVPAVASALPVPEAPKPPPSALAQFANELKAQGRLDVSAAQAASLTGGRGFPGQTEETLFGFSVRELNAPDPSARVRAAERLEALGHAAAGPALAAALHGESDGTVLVALLHAFSRFAHAEGVPVVAPLLSSPAPEVRISALKALLTLDPSQAGPHLAAAVKDPDRAVRRRASLLALSLTGKQALELGEEAIVDRDSEVRSLAALVLGASGSAEAARPWLLRAMRDPDLKVRTSAARSLSRLLGQDVTGLVSLEDAQRRREVRRLTHVEASPVKAQRRVAVLEVAPTVMKAVTPAGPTEAQCGAVLVELRSAIRGRVLGELASSINDSVEAAQAACRVLESRGQAVRRGERYFVA